MSGDTLFAVAITSTEWRSLLGHGEIRFARRRAQEIHVPPTAKEQDRLFSWGPTTILGDGNDVLVIELSDAWLHNARRHPAQPSELVMITSDVVVAHHTVGPDFHAYLLGDAEREGIQLSQGRYEEPWTRWVANQEADRDLAAAKELLRVFNLNTDLSHKRHDGYTWHDPIRLARNSKTSIKPTPKHMEDLLRSVRGISDAVAGVHETAAFDLAANVEWIEARLKKDPFAKKSTRVLIEAGLDAGRLIPWSGSGSECQPVADALTHLIEKFPRAYTSEITPQMVGATVRVIMAAKDRTLDPIDVPSAIALLTKSGTDESARTLCVALSGALGPLITRRLTRTLSSVNLTQLNWD
jgi:hypothetical protein